MRTAFVIVDGATPGSSAIRKLPVDAQKIPRTLHARRILPRLAMRTKPHGSRSGGGAASWNVPSHGGISFVVFNCRVCQDSCRYADLH